MASVSSVPKTVCLVGQTSSHLSSPLLTPAALIPCHSLNTLCVLVPQGLCTCRSTPGCSSSSSVYVRLQCHLPREASLTSVPHGCILAVLVCWPISAFRTCQLLQGRQGHCRPLLSSCVCTLEGLRWHCQMNRLAYRFSLYGGHLRPLLKMSELLPPHREIVAARV